MAHFAKLGVGNIIEQVIVVSNDIATTEQAGADFLNNLYNTNDVWKQTSYNTMGGKYYTTNENQERVESSDQSKSFRKNYAGIGYKYDQTRDAFIPPKPFNSWLLDEDTCRWKAPVDYPETYTQGLTDEQGNPKLDKYYWNENKVNWELI
jgi:hypothetical protein